VQFTYNDIESVHRLAERTGGDLAGIVVSPFRHDAGFDQELVDRSFANGVREICDVVGAALILDDVRAGFRLHLGCSWEPIGVEPDLSAWSKAMANGYPIAAVVGNDTYRTAAESLFTTGSFWFAAVPMAAALATIEALASEGAVDHMVRMGEALRAGITRQAADVGLNVRQTGPAQMPYLSFDSDHAYELADIFCVTALRHGAFVHPRHNWFVSAAMTEDDLDVVLSATSKGFAAVRRHVSAR
jgi:glutamate-1-semialdehyde 2,1-aminomutase